MLCTKSMTKEQTTNWKQTWWDRWSNYWGGSFQIEETEWKWIEDFISKIISQEREKWETEKSKEIQKLKEEWEDTNYWQNKEI